MTQIVRKPQEAGSEAVAEATGGRRQRLNFSCNFLGDRWRHCQRAAQSASVAGSRIKRMN